MKIGDIEILPLIDGKHRWTIAVERSRCRIRAHRAWSEQRGMFHPMGGLRARWADFWCGR